MENTIVVIDVPADSTAEQAAELLNAPGDSYMLVQILPVGSGQRAYLRRYKQTPPTKAEAVKEAVSDAAAMSILRANRDESVRTIVDLLAKQGIKRGKQWVCAQLDATCAEDGREEEALAIVKRMARSPVNEARDIVYELQHEYLNVGGKVKERGIKRSARWAREKLAEARAVSAKDNS